MARRTSVLAALVTVPLMLAPAVSEAVPFTVNSTADKVDENTAAPACAANDGKCTLRAAIQQANASPTVADTIAFPAGTYLLSLGQLPIDTPMTITGTGGARTTTINANGGSILDINGAVNVGLSGFALTGATGSFPRSTSRPRRSRSKTWRSTTTTRSETAGESRCSAAV